jgi:hypothetical protein
VLASFKSSEIGIAAGFAMLVEGAIAALLIWANASSSLVPEKEPETKETPIEVQPVLDDLPLLKQGSPQKAKLPEMWRKPKPRPRYEDKTAASTKAEKTLDKPVEKKELQKADKEVPPDEKAQLAKKVEEQLTEEPDEKEAKLSEQGAEDGDKDGTETDPLKAFVLDQYRKKVQAWFKAGFSPPDGSCDASLSVTANLSSSRSVTGFSVGGSSGNSSFDERVKSHMQTKVGHEVPPPPPSHPDILSMAISLRFSGETSACKRGGVKAPSGDSPDKPPSTAEDNPEAQAQKPEPVPEPAPAAPEEP